MYKTEFEVPDQKVTDAVLKFTNVDYLVEKYGLTENFLESMKDIPLHFPLM